MGVNASARRTLLPGTEKSRGSEMGSGFAVSGVELSDELSGELSDELSGVFVQGARSPAGMGRRRSGGSMSGNDSEKYCLRKVKF